MAVAPDSPPSKLPSLTGLRFVAAFAVFGFHVHTQRIFAESTTDRIFGTLFGHASVGVGFFFILSGFVLTWSARPDTPAREVWRRRAAKIYPLHLATWTIALAGLLYASSHEISLPGLLATLLLLQAWAPVEQIYFAVNTPAWSLSCEVAFYAAFPWLLRWVSRIRAGWLWPLVGLLVALAVAVSAGALTLGGDTRHWLANVWPVSRGLEFVIGMLLARIVREGRWINLRPQPAMGLVLAGFAVAAVVPEGLGYVLGPFVPFVLLIPAVAAADIVGRPSLWRHRWCVFLGEISFAFYLLHQIVIRAVDVLLGSRDWAAGPGIAIVIGALVGSLLGAWLLHRCVELPMMRVLAAPRVRGHRRRVVAQAQARP